MVRSAGVTVPGMTRNEASPSGFSMSNGVCVFKCTPASVTKATAACRRGTTCRAATVAAHGRAAVACPGSRRAAQRLRNGSRAYATASRRFQMRAMELPFPRPEASIPPVRARHVVPRPLTIEDRVTTVDEARAALERGRPVVLVTPPAPDQAGALWEVVETAGHGPAASLPLPGVCPPIVIVCADEVAAAEWAAAAPSGRRLHVVTGLRRSERFLRDLSIDVLAVTVD